MSIKSQIERIRGNVAAAYEAAAELGAELPAQRGSDNLAQLIRSLQGVSGPPDGESVYEVTARTSISAQMGTLLMRYIDMDRQVCTVTLAPGGDIKIQTPCALLLFECTAKGVGAMYTGISIAEGTAPLIPLSSSNFTVAAAISAASPELTIQLYRG